MAFVSTKSQIKNNILNYIRHLVSKTLYRSIEILFRPCCDIEITNVELVCTGTPEVFDATFTLSKSINMLGNGLLFIIGSNGQLCTTGLGQTFFAYNDTNTITIPNLDINATGPGTTGFTIFFLLTTTGDVINPGDLSPGVFVVAGTPNDASIPACI